MRLAGFAAGLATTMVSVAVPPAGIEVGANALVTVGAAKTLSVAVAAAPVPALALAIGPVELRYAPAAVAVTLTVTVHAEEAGMVAPVSAALARPAPALTAPAQPAPERAPAGVPVLTSPAG